MKLNLLYKGEVMSQHDLSGLYHNDTYNLMIDDIVNIALMRGDDEELNKTRYAKRSLGELFAETETELKQAGRVHVKTI